MSGPVSPPLATTESGTATIVRPTNTLEFNGADFTVTGSGSKATISIDSTGTGAALTDTHIGFGSAANLLTGSANFTFVDETGGNGPTVLLTGDKPRFDMQDDTAATDFKTRFEQSGASLFLFGQDSTGTDVEMIRAQPTSIVFNDDGNDLDFRHEASGGDALLWSDAGRKAVGIGTQPDSAVEKFHVKGTGTGELVRLQTDDDGAADAPTLNFYRNSASPAIGDDLGRIQFKGNDDGGAISDYAAIVTDIEDETATTENASLIFQVAEAGSLRNQLVLGSTLVSVNSSLRNVDFRVLSDDGTNNLYCDAANNNVGVGGLPSSDGTRLHIKGTGTTTLLRLESSDSGSSVAPIMDLYRNSGTPVDGDDLGKITFSGEDDGGAKQEYASISVEIADTTGGTEDARIRFNATTVGGTEQEYLRMGGQAVVFNEASGDIDFRIESNNKVDMFKIDGALDRIGIGAAPASGAGFVQIDVGESTTRALDLISRDSDANAAPTLRLNRISTTPAVQDAIGKIQFAGEDSDSNSTEYASIEGFIQDETTGSEDGDIRFKVLKGAATKEYLRMNSFGVIFNELGADQNFKIESNNDANMFVVDGGLDIVSVGRSVVSGGAQFQVENGASFYRETSNTFTANHDITVEQAHGHVLVMEASSGSANTFTLPDVGAIGMHVKLINLASSNGMTVSVSGSSSHQINGTGTAGSSSVSTTTKFQTIECHYVANNVWVATEPAVAA